MNPIRWSVATLFVSLALHTAAFAQGTADLVGRVTDTSGGVLPAVTVTATNVATKNVRTTITSDTATAMRAPVSLRTAVRLIQLPPSRLPGLTRLSSIVLGEPLPILESFGPGA